MNDHFITMDNITKIYPGNIKVLDGLNFTCKKGDFNIIIGKSGSGKTTLMNIIGQLDTKYTGNYYLDGICMNDKHTPLLIGKEIAFIFQNYQLIENFTVYQNIYLPYVYKKDNDPNIKTKIQDIMKSLFIEDLADKKINAISGGEKQRVAIARSLLLSCKLIIADEPTGNLDQANEKIVMDKLKEICEKGVTIILITHNDRLLKYGNKIYLLEGGMLHEKVL